MRICICGGGGLGHTCAGVLSNRKDVTVVLLTSRPKQWNHQFLVNIPEGKTLTGKLEVISDQAEDVIPSADIVFLCLPAFL